MSSKRIIAGILGLFITSGAMAQEVKDDLPKSGLKTNVLALAPIQMSENGVAGVGVSYERSLDARHLISFYVPATLVFNTNRDDYYGNTNTSSDPMVYLMPGIKIYPTGDAIGKAKYALGPSLVIATGQRTESNYLYSSVYPAPAPYYITRSHTIFGMIVNQSININPTPHLYIGSELGIGFSYINKLDGVNSGTTGLVQFSFKVGYRF